MGMQENTQHKSDVIFALFFTFIEYRLWLLHLQPGAHILSFFLLLKQKTQSKSKVVMCETVFSHDLKLVTPKNHTGRQLLNK